MPPLLKADRMIGGHGHRPCAPQRVTLPESTLVYKTKEYALLSKGDRDECSRLLGENALLADRILGNLGYICLDGRVVMCLCELDESRRKVWTRDFIPLSPAMNTNTATSVSQGASARPFNPNDPHRVATIDTAEGVIPSHQTDEGGEPRYAGISDAATEQPQMPGIVLSHR